MKVTYLPFFTVCLATLPTLCSAVDSGTNADQEVSHPLDHTRILDDSAVLTTGRESRADPIETGPLEITSGFAFGHLGPKITLPLASPKAIPLPLNNEKPSSKEDQPSPSLEMMAMGVNHSPHPPSAEGSLSKSRNSVWEPRLFTDIKEDFKGLRSDLRDKIL